MGGVKNQKQKNRTRCVQWDSRAMETRSGHLNQREEVGAFVYYYGWGKVTGKGSGEPYPKKSH